MKKAFSMLELMVAIMIMAMLAVMGFGAMRYSKKTKVMMDRVDVYHGARTAGNNISDLLKHASALVYPKRPSLKEDKLAYGEVTHQIIFKDFLNRIQVIYLDDKNNLCCLNYLAMDSDYRLKPPRLLAANVKKFTARRYGVAAIEYTIEYEMEGKDFSVTNMEVLPNAL